MSKPVYVIAQVRVKDFERYIGEYALPILPIFDKFEGEVLVASNNIFPIEGEWDGNWCVIVRFPDKSNAMAFYDSEDYAELKRLRIEVLSEGSNLVSLPAFDRSVLGGL